MQTYLELSCFSNESLFYELFPCIYCSLFFRSLFCLITALGLSYVYSVLLVSPDCFFNFNVYLLGIILIPESKSFHSLRLQALGIKRWVTSSLPSGWAAIQVKVWPLWSQLLDCQFGDNSSVRSFIPSYPAHSQPSIHQEFLGSPCVDFCVLILNPLKQLTRALSCRFRIARPNSNFCFWGQNYHHVLLSFHIAVIGKFSPGMEPGWPWVSTPEFPFPQ